MTRSITSHKTKNILTRALAVLFWLGVWQALSMIVGQEILLVSPVSAVYTLFQLMGTSEFYMAVCNSFGRILLGFVLALFLGIVLAVLSHMSALMEQLFSPVMATIKATPVASFVILALIWIRSSELSIFTSFLMVLPVIYENICSGFKSADPKLLEMAKVFRLNRIKKARAIYVPAAFPYLFSACSASLGICWKAGIAAEVIGQPANSIGDALYRAKIFLSTSELFAWTLAIILVSVAFEKLMVVLIMKIQALLKGT